MNADFGLWDLRQAYILKSEKNDIAKRLLVRHPIKMVQKEHK